MIVRKVFLSGMLLLLGLNMIGEPTIYPTPHDVKSSGGTANLSVVKISNTAAADKYAVKALKDVLKPAKVGSQGYRIVIGEISDKALRKYSSKVEKVSGAYYLSVTSSQTVIAGFDGAGTFYGVQTFRQLLKKRGRSVSCSFVEIKDFPDTPFRGSVEGFYGAPWKHSARLSQIEFYGKWKLNTYIYGPKDDPFHGFSNRWREPYPADSAKKIKELAEVAAKNHVDFVWAVHPGQDVHWVDKDGDGIIDDFKACIKKFEMMYDLGVRAFAVFFDDIGGEGAKPERQAQMLNYVNQNFVKVKKDVSPLIMCPTQYNKAWSGGDYLDILGTKMDKDISIMWTGNSVCCDIVSSGTDWINNRIKRKAYIWWNWPVVDYCRTALLMGRTYGVDTGNKGKFSGFTSNPMDKPEASKVALFGVADLCWNLEGFKSEESWKDSIKLLYPKVAKEMQIFVNHNSDQGPSFHGYRREESVEFKPAVDAAIQQYSAGGTFDKKIADTLSKEFRNMTVASKRLVKEIPKMNKELFHEIEYWIRAMGELGDAGTNLVQAVKITNPAKKSVLLNKVLQNLGEKERIAQLQKKRAQDDTTPGDRRWAKGCKVGGTIVTPFVLNTLDGELAKTYEKFSGKPASTETAEKYEMVGNVQTLVKASVERKKNDIVMNQNFEVHKFKKGQFLGMLLPNGIPAQKLSLKASSADKLVIEVTKDGKSWEKTDVNVNGEHITANINLEKAFRGVRFINKTASTIEVKISEFKVSIPGDVTFNSIASITDGNVKSFYQGEFKKGQVLKVPTNSLVRASKYILFSDGSFVVSKKGRDVLIRSNIDQIAKLYELVPVK